MELDEKLTPTPRHFILRKRMIKLFIIEGNIWLTSNHKEMVRLCILRSMLS